MENIYKFIQKTSFKTIFNEIYKNFLKKRSDDEVMSTSIKIETLYYKIKNLEEKNKNQNLELDRENLYVVNEVSKISTLIIDYPYKDSCFYKIKKNQESKILYITALFLYIYNKYDFINKT